MPTKFQRDDFREHAHGTQRFAVRRRQPFFRTRRQPSTRLIILVTVPAVIALFIADPLIKHAFAPAPAEVEMATGVVIEKRLHQADDEEPLYTVRIEVPRGNAPPLDGWVSLGREAWQALQAGAHVKVKLAMDPDTGAATVTAVVPDRPPDTGEAPSGEPEPPPPPAKENPR